MALIFAVLFAAPVSVSIVRTATLAVREGMLFFGGDFATTVQNDFSAVLVQHDGSYLLFDTGLGRNVRAQYEQDMPLWRRPFFRYEDPVSAVSDQLAAAGVRHVDRIILSHAHWDHASGVEDFPGVSVWTSKEELEVIRRAAGGLGGAWRSQVSSPTINFNALTFNGGAYEGFERSCDIYGDGSVIVVEMFGHTPGSVGMFVTTESGRRFFFVGDVVWSAAALAESRPKIWLARHAADHDIDATQRSIDKIRDVMRRDPSLVVVPAHDARVQRALATFPDWLR